MPAVADGLVAECSLLSGGANVMTPKAVVALSAAKSSMAECEVALAANLAGSAM
jgi:hypothetical protein